MDQGEGGPEYVFGQALLHQRSRLHTTLRLATRAIQVGLARQSGTPRRHLVLGVTTSALWDVAVGVVLGRTKRFALVPRLVADATDTALWSLHHDRADLASLTGVPLAMETGIRKGPWGLLVPATNALVTAFVRRSKGYSRSLASFRFQVMAVACGAGLARYEESRRNVSLAQHRHELDAQSQRAYLAGQNDVAMGADSIIDLLSRTDPLLASMSYPADRLRMTTGRELAAWKQSLATTTANHASYLGVVLAQFERTNNGAQPDLAADVTFDLSEGDGTLTLTPQQATTLVDLLGKLSARGNLRGRIRVSRLQRSSTSDPNLPVHLLIGGHTIEIPPDPHSDLDPFDVGPLGFVTATFWTVDSLLPTGPRSDVRFVAPLAAAEAALVVWSHRQLVRHGREAHFRILAAALIAGAFDCVAVTTTMGRTRNADGVGLFPASSSITPALLILPLYWDDLSEVERKVSIAALLFIVALGVAIHPDRPPLRHVVMELLWPISAVISMASVDASFAAQEEEVRVQTADSDRRALSDAFDDGRASVINLATSGYRRTARAFDEVRPELDPAIAAEVERRLNEVTKRLEDL